MATQNACANDDTLIMLQVVHKYIYMSQSYTTNILHCLQSKKVIRSVGIYKPALQTIYIVTMYLQGMTLLTKQKGLIDLSEYTALLHHWICSYQYTTTVLLLGVWDIATSSV